MHHYFLRRMEKLKAVRNYYRYRSGRRSENKAEEEERIRLEQEAQAAEQARIEQEQAAAAEQERIAQEASCSASSTRAGCTAKPR